MQLSKKQNEYILNANHRWNIKVGAVRSGKSYVDIAYQIPSRIIERKGKSGLNVIMGVSKSTIERNVLQPLREIYVPDLVSQINNDNIAMVCGQPTYCLGAEKISQVSKVQGMSIKYFYGDEVAKWNEEVFAMVKSRLDKSYSCADMACNPEGSNHWFKKFLDSDIDIYNQHYQIFDNPFLPADFVENLCKEYDGTIYYDRYIKGLWKRAEGAIYVKFADNPDKYLINDEWLKNNPISYGIIGVDFGGTKSAHSFTFTGFTRGFKDVVVMKEYYKKERIGPETLEADFCNFVKEVLEKYKCYEIYCDSAEQTLITGFESAVIKNRIPVEIKNAKKGAINDRIAFTVAMMGQGRFKVHESCTNLIDALQNAVYDSKKDTVDSRLDDGVMNIDSLDSMEYSFESVMKNIMYL